MVLFDEDPVTLISETTNQFHIAPDRESLTRISGSLHALANARQSRLDNQQSILKTLSRRLNNLQSQQHFEEERHDAGAHASEMLKLDTEKFRIAKGVSDVEIEGERLQGELAGLKAQLETLKLQFYRTLGIDVSQDAGTGEFTRAIIRNKARGDVNVVKANLEPGRLLLQGLDGITVKNVSAHKPAYDGLTASVSSVNMSCLTTPSIYS
nr:putative kinetochore protein spc24 [Quercus suber]